LPVGLFRVQCERCHDSDGRGEVVRDVLRSIPDFTDAGWQDSQTDEDLSRAILEGRGKSMPAMKRKVTREEAGRLVALVRAFRGGRVVIPDEDSPGPSTKPEVPPPRVTQTDHSPLGDSSEAARRAASTTFQRTCRGCHGPDGKGEGTRALMPEIPDFSNRSWQGLRNRAELVASVLEGKGSHMPAFRDRLTEGQVQGVVDLIRGLGPPGVLPVDSKAGEFKVRFTRLSQEFESLRREFRAISDREGQREARHQPASNRNN
jgi:mono/diheme cytochrome c family protein